MPTYPDRGRLLPSESQRRSYSTGFLHSGDNPGHRQLPLMWPVPSEPVQPAESNPWSGPARAATWLEIARMLPANLSLETTDGRTWRIVHLPADARRALELLDLYEGDVIPTAERIEAARRRAHAEDLLATAQAVLRAVDAEQRAAHLTRNRKDDVA